MKQQSEFVTYAEELLAPFGDIKIRRMFGGYGLYCDGIFFAIIADDILYFKVDASNHNNYKDHGMEPFTYQGKKGPVALSYFEVPAAVLEDTTLLGEFMAKSVKIGLKTTSRNDQQ